MPDRTCETCAWWQQGGAPIASASRNNKASDYLGTCQVGPPILAPSPHFPVGMFPETHADRFCGEWAPEPDHSDGGEEQPVVTHLRRVA